MCLLECVSHALGHECVRVCMGVCVSAPVPFPEKVNKQNLYLTVDAGAVAAHPTGA